LIPFADVILEHRIYFNALFDLDYGRNLNGKPEVQFQTTIGFVIREIARSFSILTVLDKQLFTDILRDLFLSKKKLFLFFCCEIKENKSEDEKIL
jgi:hypothetical protein